MFDVSYYSGNELFFYYCGNLIPRTIMFVEDPTSPGDYAFVDMFTGALGSSPPVNISGGLGGGFNINATLSSVTVNGVGVSSYPNSREFVKAVNDVCCLMPASTTQGIQDNANAISVIQDQLESVDKTFSGSFIPGTAQNVAAGYPVGSWWRLNSGVSGVMGRKYFHKTSGVWVEISPDWMSQVLEDHDNRIIALEAAGSNGGQVEITSSCDINPAWNGKTVIVSNHVTLSVPSGGLPASFQFQGFVTVGGEVTWALKTTTPTNIMSWLYGAPQKTGERKTFTFMKRGATNNVILVA